MVHDQRVEIARVSEGAPHHLRIGDASVAVGERDRARGLEQADLGHLLAAHALGQRRHRVDVDDGRVAGAAQHEIDGGGIVDHGLGAGLADDRGDAAGCRGLACRGERLAMTEAGLADKGAHVDQSGRHYQARAIDDVGALRHAGRADAAPRIADAAVGDQDVAGRVEIARGIDHARIGEQDRTAVGQHRRSSLRVRQVAGERFQHRHAHRHSHFHLFADQ